MNYNSSYQTRRLEIAFIVSLGYNVLEVEIGDTSIFFVTNDFEPPSIGSVMSAPYMTMTGRDITEFIENAGFNQANTNLFKERLEKLLLETRERSFKFSDKHTWRYFN